MTKKQLALEIIRRLKEAYPDAGCTLDYDEAWKLNDPPKMVHRSTIPSTC